jgi:hypothetical protein
MGGCFSIFLIIGFLLIFIDEHSSKNKKNSRTSTTTWNSHASRKQKENQANQKYIDAIFVLDAAQHGVIVPGTERVFEELDESDEENGGDPYPDWEEDHDSGSNYEDYEDYEDYDQDGY